ncbi:uncharacterized protein [Montipora foliosa]|uniref:uncharacterized protein n=1 Tax=Montipora foliosa TaxID=591990 RepID=UPI0035F1ABDD
MVYADDTQLYISISSLDDRPSALSLLETCTRDILIWCTINGLACNPDKTEIIHLSSCFSKTPPIHTFNVNGYRISVRSLGVTLDRHLQMSQHVNMLCKSAFFSLKNISKIRKFLDRDNTKRLVHAFISSKIDYCNSILIGLPNEEIDKIQHVQNAAARLISGTKKYASITPILIKLHWLPVIARIEYKILLTVFKSLNNLAPEYISELLNQYNPPRALRSANKNLLIVPKTLNKTYGDGSCGMNVHDAGSHLVDYVEAWGPLWAWSTLGFEDMNGTLMDYCHGTGIVCRQFKESERGNWVPDRSWCKETNWVGTSFN